MSQRPITRFGIRIRLIVVSVIVGLALGGYIGARWESRNDSVQMQRIFLQEYLPQRVEQALGIEPLHGLFQPSHPAVNWMQQVPVNTQMPYWHAQFAGRMQWIDGFAFSFAMLLVVITLRTTRRRQIDIDNSGDLHRIRHHVARPWD